MKILVASSNSELLNDIQRTFCRENLIVDLVHDGEDAWHQLHAYFYDALLLDSALPKLDGVTLCRKIREVGNPLLILLLTPSGNQETLVQGLENGADACLTRPFEEKMLMAHLRALSRGRGMRRTRQILTWGGLQLDPSARKTTYDGLELKLNRKEYQLLELLLSQPRRVFSQSDIAERLWALDEPLPADGTVRSHMRSLRRKLEQAGLPELITTHYGQGYRLNPAGDSHHHELSPSDEPDSLTAHFWREAMGANARLQQEIERRKQVEFQLRRSHEIVLATQRVAQIGYWEADLTTKKVYWTEELFLIHGLPPSSSPPPLEDALRLIHPDDLDLHEREVRTPALQGKPFEANLRIVRANDGQVRTVNARGGPVFDSNGKLTRLVGTTFDITRWL